MLPPCFFLPFLVLVPTLVVPKGESKKTQLDEDLKQHTADRDAAKAAMAEATGLRKKEAAAHAASASENSANIAATAKATAAVEKGMGAAFLQTATANVLRNIVQHSQGMADSDKDQLTAFLSNGEGYAPASGEIVGILKTMHDEMSADSADETATEDVRVFIPIYCNL